MCVGPRGPEPIVVSAGDHPAGACMRMIAVDRKSRYKSSRVNVVCL